MAEWLGRGLQNLVQRFESASDLQNCRADDFSSRLFCFGGFVREQAHAERCTFSKTHSPISRYTVGVTP